MRICLPTTGKKGWEETVYNHFGSAQYFTIYDSNTREVSVVENENQHHNHGSCQPLDIISQNKVDIVMTSGMGRRAVMMLNEGGVRVYLLQGNTVKEAVSLWEANTLQELTPENSCAGHDCH